jgi:hypothetical protein
VWRIAGIAPGAALLLHADGAAKVRTVLRLIDTIEVQRIDPTDVAVSYWRTAHTWFAARAAVMPYTQEQHAAHLARRTLT